MEGLLFVLELFEVVVNKAQFAAMESLELNVESRWGLVNSPVEVLVVVGEFLLLILLHPLGYLLLHF